MSEASPAAPPLEPATRAPVPTHHGSLFRKYGLILVFLISGALLTSSLVEAIFAYQESWAALGRLQRREATAAADAIEQFVGGIERQITLSLQPVWAAGRRADAADERRYAFLGLLRLVPAITELRYVDAAGKEQLRVSRVAMDAIGSGQDYSGAAWFQQLRTGAVYRGPVVFRDGYEPVMTLAFAEPEPERGVTVAEVDLTLIWDVVSRLTVGRRGYAYVVDAAGQLIAHPDISQVLQKPVVADLPQVRAALSDDPTPNDEARAPLEAISLDGRPVLSSYALIEPFGARQSPTWRIVVEQPLEEARAPLGALLLRSVLLLLVGLAVATVASLALARRLVTPIRALQAGAARIGDGDLDHRIAIRTGDELEDLADQFNRMTDRLGESYRTLEQTVEERTRELADAVRKLQALARVSQTVSATLDLGRVLTTIVVHAVALSEADGGVIFEFDAATERFQLRATETVDPALAEVLRAAPPRLGEGAVGRAAEERAPVQIADIARAGSYADRGDLRDALLAAGFQSLLAVPLLVEGRVLGGLVIGRAEPGPFRRRVVELLETFAGQSALAIQNARLFEAVRAKSRELEVQDLGRFLPRQVANLIIASGDKALLDSHRRPITVVFCDLRGSTDFADTAEPEHVIEFYREYFRALGPLVDQYEGTLERFTGDGIMVFFNDPVPIPDPRERAVKMAVEMRERVRALTQDWEVKLGRRRLGFGVGIDHDFATLGRIGYEGRFDYAATGAVTIRAFRLCAEAKDGQILITQPVYAAVRAGVDAETIGDLALKGFREPVRTYNVLRLA